MANIIDLIDDAKVFAPWFARGDWRAWRSFLAALFALPMTRTEAATYRRCTGRTGRPKTAATEAWLVVGRRGGKSFILALAAVYLATFKNWRQHLAPGERGVVMVLAADRRQAKVIFGYVKALLTDVPMLARLVERETSEVIDLTNGVSVEIHTTSYRTIRGRTVVAALLDEIAFWRTDDSASPDAEILAALRPSMATVPGAILLAASSPYARRGVLYKAHRDHYGKSGPALVWQADTRTMNPSVPEAVVKAAYEADPASAAAEYGAQFRSDVESFVAREAIDACTVEGRRELPPVAGVNYTAFVDPSGGSQDSFTLAVAHLDGKTAVLDAVRERKPPFSPADVVDEFATLLKSYGISQITGDRYAGIWPVEAFSNVGIRYWQSARPKSDLYRDFLPLLNAGNVELLDLPRLAAQLVSLERRTARGGRDSIDHAPGGHDDLANVAAGAIVELGRAGPEILIWGGDDLRLPGETRRADGRASEYRGGSFSNFIRGNP